MPYEWTMINPLECKGSAIALLLGQSTERYPESQSYEGLLGEVPINRPESRLNRRDRR
jgi:hypothetical protein